MEQIKAFIEKANTDSELMAKLDALGAKNADAENVIALAAEYGFTFTEQEYEQAKTQARAKTGELSEEDLDAVSGGTLFTRNRYDRNRCKPTLTRYISECINVFFWCDHYRREYNVCCQNGHRHICVMGAFNYIGNTHGEPHSHV